MTDISVETHVFHWLGLVLSVGGIVTALTLLLMDPGSAMRKRWAEHVASLDREVRFQLLKTTGLKIAIGQLVFCLALPFVVMITGEAIWLLLVVPGVFGPSLYLAQKHAERVRLLEETLDSWLLMLANALKASPSLGEGIQSSARLMRAPFSEELDLVIKEMKLGTPLDQAVLNMSSRIKSRIISSSLATILVGRQTGGDLPQILEQSAATLREMQRLEGVVRTKTAEGKMQAIVLAAIPFVLLFALHMVDDQWLKPLFETSIGWIVLTIATMFWAAAILIARKILTVDI